MTTICCVCQKTKIGDDWVIKPIDKEHMISHGYCPACFARAKEKVAAFFTTPAA